MRPGTRSAATCAAAPDTRTSSPRCCGPPRSSGQTRHSRPPSPRYDGRGTPYRRVRDDGGSMTTTEAPARAEAPVAGPFGARVLRKEDLRLAAGKGRYVDDLGQHALAAAFL